MGNRAVARMLAAAHAGPDAGVARATRLDVRTLQRTIGNRATARLLGVNADPAAGVAQRELRAAEGDAAGDALDAGGGSIVRRLLQRKPLTQGKLNIAGENHGESGGRRADERAYALDEAGGGYWTEGEFTAKPSAFATARFGDPLMLRAEMLLAILKEKHVAKLLEPFARGQIPAAFPQDGNAAGLWDLYKVNLSGDVEEIARAIGLASNDPAEEAQAAKAEGAHAALEALAIQIDAAALADAPDVLAAAKAAIALFAADVLNQADIRAEAVVSNLRSEAMNSAAKDEAARWVGGKTGVWKVGDTHVAEMIAVKGGAGYEIMTKDEFNADFVKWKAANRP